MSISLREKRLRRRVPPTGAGPSTPTSSPRYVVIFKGRRDYYEVPLALAEADVLERLVTDQYLPSLGGLTSLATCVLPALERRHRQGLPSRMVTTTERWASRTTSTDREVGLMGAQVAIQTGAIPIVYSYYLAGFLEGTGRSEAGPVVFQVHPIAQQVRTAMEACHAADRVICPEDEELLSAQEVEAEVERLTAASRFVVASSCTRRGLIDAGFERDRVAPLIYGGDRAGLGALREGPRAGKLRLLFVGQVSRRKGIGTLLQALGQLGPTAVELTIVTRDKRIESFASDLASCGVVVRSVDDRHLPDVFGGHDVLVLPSYIEGAGLVLSEALAAGLWVIGTPESAAPELIDRYGSGLLVNPGQPVALAAAIESMMARTPEIREARTDAAKRGAPLGPSWAGFRADLRAALGVHRLGNDERTSECC